MTQETKNTQGSDLVSAILGQITIGGQPLNPEQIAFATEFGNILLKTAEGQKLQAEIAKASAEADLASLNALTIRISLMQMKAKQAAEARQLAAPWHMSLHEEVTNQTMGEKQREMMKVHDLWPGRAFDFLINTPGGSVTDGMMLYDFILMMRSFGHHFTITALGQASSMGSIILQAGDWRVAGPDARILIHAPRGGTIHDLIDLWDVLATRLAKRSTMSVKQIKAKVKNVTDWWLPAPEALKLGFIDEIIQIPDETKSLRPPVDPNQARTADNANATANAAADGSEEAAS